MTKSKGSVAPDNISSSKATDTTTRRNSKDTATREQDDPLLPYLQRSTLPGDVVHSLLTDGYVVLPSVLSSEECASALDLLWDFVTDVSGAVVRRNDPDSWYDHGTSSHEDTDPWPHTGYSFFPDMFQSHGAGFLLGEVREKMAERIFSKLFGTTELHASKEGFTYHW